MSQSNSMPPETEMSSTDTTQVLETWQEVDEIMQRVQVAVRDYASDLNEYFSTQEQSQAQVIDQIRQDLIEQFNTQRQQLEQQANQLAAERGQFAEQQQELERRWAELERTREDLDDREVRLDQQANRQLESSERLEKLQAELGTKGQEFESQLESIEGLKAELEKRDKQVAQQQTAVAQREAELQERVDQQDELLKQKVAELETQYEQRETELQKQTGQQDELLEQKVAELEAQYKQRIAELEGEQSVTREDLDKREAKLAMKEQEFQMMADRVAQEMREKKESHDAAIDQRDATLAKRELKCREIEEQIEQQRQQIEAHKAELEPAGQSAEGVLQRHNEVAAASQSLAETEARLIRQWGLQKASKIAIAAMVLLGINIAIGHLLSGLVANGSWVASAAVKFQLPAGTNTDAWLDSQTRALRTKPAIDRTIVAMRQSGYSGPTTPDHIQQIISQGLHVYSPAPGELHLELHSPIKSELVPMLQGLVRSAATDPNTGKDVPGVTIAKAATLAAEPIDENRTMRNLMMTGVSLALSMVIVFMAMKVVTRRAHRQPRATVGHVAADAQVWAQHAKHLKHNPNAEEQESPSFNTARVTPKNSAKANEHKDKANPLVGGAAPEMRSLDKPDQDPGRNDNTLAPEFKPL